MMNYFDRVLYLYPGIEKVMYWGSQPDGKPWDDPYDGLEWNNPDIKKPSKKTLEALDIGIVSGELEKRKQIEIGNKFCKENPLQHLEGVLKDMQKDIELLKVSLADTNKVINDFTKAAALQSIETREGMTAIKGFLMMIPDIQKSLSEMQSNINQGTHT